MKIFVEVNINCLATLFAYILQIELGFLMVGHTHEDIDQTFSCLSRKLHENAALSMSGKNYNCNT